MMFPAELKILKGYNQMDPILLSDYITDFVIENPMNYPVTSWIMKTVDAHGYTMNELFSRIEIMNRVSKNITNLNCNVLTYMLYEQETGFNLFALSLLKQAYVISVMQKEPTLLFSVYNPDNSEWKVLLDQNLNDFLMYNLENSVDLLTDLRTNQYSSILDLVEKTNSEVIYPQMSQENKLTDIEKLCAIINVVNYDSIFDCHDCGKCTTSFLQEVEHFDHRGSDIFTRVKRYGTLTKYKMHEKRFSERSSHPQQISDNSISCIKMR